jgi:hypothetical protein
MRLYKSAKEWVRRWHADIASGVSSYEPRGAEQYLDLYRAFDRITPFVDRMVASGAVVEGADRFGRERMYLKATLAISPEKARRAAEQIAAGQVKPAAEVRRELLRREFIATSKVPA